MNEERKNDTEQVLRLRKKRSPLWHILFGRATVIILLLLAQILLLAWAFSRLGELYYGGIAVVSLVAALVVYARVDKPAVRTTWMLLIMLVPVFAIPFFIIVDCDLGYRMIRRRLGEIRDETRELLPRRQEDSSALHGRDPGAGGLADYVWHVNRQSVYRNSGVRYFPTGESAFEEMLVQLEKAKDFIFIEYFVIEEGYMWGRILSILQRKRREGVEIRVLYDGTCAVAKLPYGYPKDLEALGIPCKMFAPLRPLVSTYYNNRDHRKILVVDGQVAFTGGYNLADEYINVKHLHGYWKDSGVMVTGSAVRSFTLMFLQMWNVDLAAGTEDYRKYLDVTKAVEAEGFVMPYGDSPFSREHVGEHVYMDILARATKYVHITTPYLVMDHELATALIYAAKRGVEVKLMTPGVPDKKPVFALTRAGYAKLIEAGVEVYEYTPGFLHSKMFTSDGKTAVVGSINLDYRSLDLHFECAALLYDCPAVADVEKDIQDILSVSRRITPEDCRRRSPWQRLLGWILRPLAPLM